MSSSRVPFAADRWLAFLEEYRRRVPADPLGIAAYQLFTDIRDATPGGWLKEPLKALHFSLLSSTGTEAEKLPLAPSYDYCFVVDGPGVPGLLTSAPVIRSLPAGRRALLLGRDHVVRDPRFAEFLRSPACAVVNVDRVRAPGGWLSAAARQMGEVLRAFPQGLPSVPKLVLRRLHFAHVLDRLLERVTVGCMVVTNERLILAGAAIHEAKRRGIPTTCLQHGALIEQYLPVTVDTYLTWGAHASRWLREHGVGARIIEIGAPRLDRLAACRPAAPARREATPLVAFFSQKPGVDMPKACYHQVEREFLSLLDGTDATLCVKLHPSDDPDRWRSEVRGAPHRVRLLGSSHDPYQVMAEADYIGAFYSTVLVEAMLFDKPVFQLNPFGSGVPDYSERAGCSPIADGNALREWIRRCGSDRGFRGDVVARQRAFVRDYFATLGNASASFYRSLDTALPARAGAGGPPNVRRDS